MRHEMTNKEYHANSTHISSSGLKLILNSPQEYYQQYILGNRKPLGNQAALDFGTLCHTMILEPHLFEESYVIWKGDTKIGKAFKSFKELNKDKIVISTKEFEKLNILHEAYLNNEAAITLVDNCKFEHTMFCDLEEVPVKCRADAINIENGLIIDVKTTSLAGDNESFKETIQKYQYDLSAALYCRIAEMVYNRPFEFYYIVLSKNELDCNIYKSTLLEINMGNNKVNQALKDFKKYKLTNNWNLDNLVSDSKEIGTYNKELFK